ncbi:MAG: HNH endonuclease signature motif containing protein [Candidatus Bathyarchaeia archaeon]
MSEIPSLRLFYNYGRLPMQKIWGAQRVMAIRLDHDSSLVTDGKKYFCRNCGRDLSFNPRLRAWCSRRCEIAFYCRFNHTWREFAVAVYERDGGKCRICGKDLAERRFACDHIIPLSQGGRDWWQDPAMTNFQTLCESCHRKKTALDLKKPKKAKEKAKLQVMRKQQTNSLLQWIDMQVMACEVK